MDGFKRCAVMLTAPDGFQLDQEKEVQIVWSLLTGGKGIPSHDDEKPFSFYFNAGYSDDGEVSFTLIFSSMLENITMTLYESAQNLVNTAIMIGSTEKLPVVIKKCIPIQNTAYFAFMMNYRTCSPVFVNQCSNLCSDMWLRKIKGALIRRAKKFLGVDVDPRKVKVSLKKFHYFSKVPYKQYDFSTVSVDLKIRAPKEIQMAALYGGIGAKTGSGFGAVNFM